MSSYTITQLMKIIVLGAGVLGVSSAYFLASRGHEVEVIDRNAQSACETTYSNGGQLSYSHAEPWASPSVLPKVLKWMFNDDAPLVMRPRADYHMLRWGLSFLANCRMEKVAANTSNLLRLGLYSRKKMEQLRTITGIEFDNVREGILNIFSRQVDFDAAIRQAEYQRKFGCTEDILTPEDCIRIEPALAHMGPALLGGVHDPLDESGDAREFTRKLAELTEKEFNTRYHYNTNIHRLNSEKGRIVSVTTDKGNMQADAYVMAMGSFSAITLRDIGIRVPIYPLKGYSVTFPANEYTPKASVSDGESKIVFSRLGDKLRVAGTAEFAGYNMRISDKRVNSIIKLSRRFFPKCNTDDVLETWACLRPSTPDGPPIIGACKYENLYLNTGHGTLGWTQAAGSAALLADIMENRPTEINLTGLTIERYM